MRLYLLSITFLTNLTLSSSRAGEFRENVPNGMGTLKTPDGASYIGMWVDGSKHGRGRYRWPSGKVYEGDWKDGLQHGYGKLYAPPPSATEGGLGGKHVGTNGHVGDVLYEGQFYKGDDYAVVMIIFLFPTLKASKLWLSLTRAEFLMWCS